MKIQGAMLAFAAGACLLAAPGTALAAPTAPTAVGWTDVSVQACTKWVAQREGTNGGKSYCATGSGIAQVRLTCARETGGANYFVYGPRVSSTNGVGASRAKCRGVDAVVRVESV